MPFDVSTILTSSIAGSVFGAAVNLFMSGQNAKRGEWSARVDSLVKDINELSGLTIDYWTKAEASGDELTRGSILISVRLHDINRQLKALAGHGVTWTYGTEEITEAYKRLHEAATGGDFGSPQRQVSVDRAREAGDECSTLKAAVHTARKALIG